MLTSKSGPKGHKLVDNILNTLFTYSWTCK